MRQLFEGRRQSPFAGLGDHDASVGGRLQSPQDLAVQRRGRLRIAQPHVTHVDPSLPQSLGELAHGGEDEDELLLVVGDIGRLVHHLRHQHGIACRVDVGER